MACFAEENSESSLISEIEQDMKLFSDIATDTNQNVDYMPYVISTLDSEDLENIGVQNLREAISLIPGVDLNVGMAGVKNPIFRGSNPYAFGQSRLIIDGVVVNDQLFGGYNQYLDLPIDIIHRIEVVRGPGSLLSHVNGYAGSIHVITKANRDDGQKQPDKVFVFAGSNDLMSAGVVKSFDLAGGRFSSDIYYQQHDLHLPVGDDRFNTLAPSSGNTDQSLKNYQVGLNYKNGGLHIKGRLSKNDSGVSYGQAFSLTDDTSDFLNVDNNSLDIKYIKEITNNVSFEIGLDYFDEIRKLQNKVMPDGAMGGALVNGRYLLVDYSEQTLGERAQLNINFSDEHKLKIGVISKQSKIINNNYSTSDDNLVTFNNNSLLSNNKRDSTTLYFEDIIDLSEKTTLQLGGKHSEFNDIANQSTYRLALVHRYNDENTYKAMFSQAYREPSWREQYLKAPAFFKANPVLTPEKVDAYELGFIRRLGHRDFFKANAFLLKNSEQIDAQNASTKFNNTSKNDLYGFELEYENNLFANDVLSINYSYIDGSNVSGTLANSASSLVKLYYLHRVNQRWNLSSLVKYIGEKKRVNLDTRSSVPAYSLLDLTASYQSSPDTAKYSFIIKNVFDQKYFLPSPNGTYATDFEQPGRIWMIRLSKEF